MSIFDFIKNKKNKNLHTTETPQMKLKNELLSRCYNRAYLFYGEYDKDIEINGETITYTHCECFLANTKRLGYSTEVIRLTGDNITGNPIRVSKCEPWICCEYVGTTIYVHDDDIEYKISSASCLDANYLNYHYMTGHDAELKTNNYNAYRINYALNELREQKSIDNIFQK